jgi:hypothetical protein
LSQRNNSTRNLERRAEREARQLGNTPRAQRQRPGAPAAKSRRGGFFSRVSPVGIAVVVGVTVIVGALVYAVTQVNNHVDTQDGWREAQLDDSTNLPGAYVAPHPGVDQLGTTDDRNHFSNGVVVPICTAEQIASNNLSNPLCYQSNPPTSGPHAISPSPFTILNNPAPKENMIHNMEHGGIVVWYNTSDQRVIDQLKGYVQDELDQRHFVVMTAYSEMEPDTIALTAWTRLDKFPTSELTRDRVENFIEEHDRRFNPEGF